MRVRVVQEYGERPNDADNKEDAVLLSGLRAGEMNRDKRRPHQNNKPTQETEKFVEIGLHTILLAELSRHTSQQTGLDRRNTRCY